MGFATLETFKTLEEAETAKKKSIEDYGWDEDRLFIFNERDEEEPYHLCLD